MPHWQSIDSSQIAKRLNFKGATKTKKAPPELAQYLAKTILFLF